MWVSATALIHASRLGPVFAVRLSRLEDFFNGAQRGALPTYSFIEPSLLHPHNDYRPAMNVL